MPRPRAVLLDVGGVFYLPSHDRIAGALARAEVQVDPGVLDAAHYVGASCLGLDLDAEGDWADYWGHYLRGYVDACGVAPEAREDAHRHLDSEFADAELWRREAPGCRAGLAAVVGTGVRLGVVSNADGFVAARLHTDEILQVGPGLGTHVECVIDSGAVGVTKPDPRIFRLALDALGLEADDVWYVGDTPGIDVVGARRAGLRPILMDPLGLHRDAGFGRVASLSELAALVGAA